MANILAAAVIALSPMSMKFLPRAKVAMEDYAKVIVCLIDIESSGRSGLISPSGNHYGILQISEPYLTDARDIDDTLPSDPAALLYDSNASMWTFRAYMEKYHFLHRGDADTMALLHTAGPGRLSEIAAGAELNEREEEYMRRFKGRMRWYTNLM